MIQGNVTFQGGVSRRDIKSSPHLVSATSCVLNVGSLGRCMELVGPTAKHTLINPQFLACMYAYVCVLLPGGKKANGMRKKRSVDGSRTIRDDVKQSNRESDSSTRVRRIRQIESCRGRCSSPSELESAGHAVTKDKIEGRRVGWECDVSGRALG